LSLVKALGGYESWALAKYRLTGPFKINGVPLRRVNARYVIATSTSVDVGSVDSKILEKASDDGYFTKDKASKKPGEDAFFKQGEKPEVGRHGTSEVNLH
jgi:ribosomal protein L14E/L6E/L27E